MEVDDLIELIMKICDSRIIAANGGATNPIVYGVFVEPEVLDENLSVVEVTGDTAGTLIRGVRKLRDVAALAAGDVLMMMKTNNTPLTILGVVTGNITLIEVD